MRYSEMRNVNEEGLLYLGWFFQLTSAEVRKVAYPLFQQLANRLQDLTKSPLMKTYVTQFVRKAQESLRETA